MNPNQPIQPQQNQGQQINIKITDEVLGGKYANMMQVAHTKEEFILDFMNVMPPNGIVNARIITSPGHIKRIVKALDENLKKYEATHGKIEEASAPNELGFSDRK